MVLQNENDKSILIASVTPQLLGKPRFWFDENSEKLIEAAKTQPWWQDNILYLTEGQFTSVSEVLRKLDEMGYEKSQTISEPGEFSLRGGIIDAFPVNSEVAIRIVFWGSAIESITTLTHIRTDESEESLKKRFLKKLKFQEEFSELGQLKPSDYIVHLDHGIARFCGIENFQFSNSNFPSDYNDQNSKIQNRQYYVLEYAQGDKLFIPVGLERKLSRYVGFTIPTISRLGTDLWIKTRRKIKEETEKLAKDLLDIYAKREVSIRPPIFWNDDFVKTVEHSFEHVETDDQLKAIEDLRNDFQKDKPMDRILVGDVGFGKTEVALRAITTVIAQGKQVAVLCPTTILAHQHWRTFCRRLSPLPIHIGMLSRIQTKKEQRSTVEAIKKGECDLAIGTHRLLSQDVEFANLGLLVIDEEQRFGVKHKEKFKKMRSAIDILSLSATPIPRTLYLALSSLRDISRVNTPPPERMPIETFVAPWNETTIKKAIEFEIRRKGQVYYLHNRVETIEAARALLEKLIPDARVAVAHGKLSEKELIDIMEKFYRHEIDILVATTIIENGLDIPNVNTLIADDATRLGLSQAHQIRGRIGRSYVQAYAYFLYGDHLTEEAKKRLEALQEYQALGSGYRIALRDLEMRGAGNILGKEQSGHVNALGLNLYCQMLADAVEIVAKQK